MIYTKSFYSITEVSSLLGVSRPTIYKWIEDGKIQALHYSARIVRISAECLRQLHQEVSKSKEAKATEKKEQLIKADEAIKTLNISPAWFYKRTKQLGITPVKKEGVYSLYDAKQIRLAFIRRDAHSDIKSWYTAAELAQSTGMKLSSIYEYCHDHQIPRKKEGKRVNISKVHWDRARAHINDNK